jgi:hypothetical protein
MTFTIIEIVRRLAGPRPNLSTEFHATVLAGREKCMRFIGVYRVGLTSVPFEGMMVAGITVETDCFESE